MKTLPLIFLLSSSVLTIAETIEFRTFTIDTHNDSKPLTEAQLKHALTSQNLSAESSISVISKNGKFSFNDTIQAPYVTEYDSDYAVAQTDQKQVGTLITGSITSGQNTKSLDFSFSHTIKDGYITYGGKDDKAILTPVFNTINHTSSITMDTADSNWFVFTVSATPSGNNYLAVRIKN